MLHLGLLGTPILAVDGRAVKLGAKHLALLAYLALEGRSSRRALGGLLWPEAPNALNNTSVARNAVVKALGAGALIADAQTLALGAEVGCDLMEWREGAARADAGAWALWRGELLSGLRLQDWELGLGAAFEEWLEDSRSQLAAERRDFALRLAALTVTQNLAACADYLEVAAGSDEPREDATRALMLALGALGQSDRAAQVCARLSAGLEEELGVQVSTRTRDALELLRSGNKAACLEQLKTALGHAPRAVPVVLSAAEPFVGRANDVAQLCQTLEPQHSALRVAVISGEPGAGKSRLALEVSLALNLPRVHVTFAPASLPLTLIEALVRTQRETSSFAALPDDWRTALNRLAPDGSEAQPSPALPPELERRAVFSGAKSLLEGAGVLIVDDLQWADAESLEFLQALIAQPPASGLAMIGTLRSTEAAPIGVEVFLERVARLDLGVHHRLTALKSADLETLAAALGRSDVNPEELRTSSGGNPFYALELLRSEGTTRSGRVHDLVGARLHQLEDAARQILETLVVTGNAANPGVLRRVSGRSVEEFSAALERLEGAHLLRVTGDALGFVHDLVRETVDGTLSGARRTLLHLRAARATHELERSAGHYLSALSAWDEADATRGVQAFIAMAAQSATRGDLKLSLTWFHKALEHATGDDWRVRALLERAHWLAVHGKPSEALESLESADLHLETLGDVILHARALVTRASLENKDLRRPDLAREHVERALHILEGAKGARALELRADALTLAAMIAHNKTHHTEALECGTQALQMARTLQDPTRQASALSALGVAAVALGDERAEVYLLECLSIRERANDVFGMGRALNNLSLLYGAQNETSKAISVLERALALQRRLGNAMDAAITLANIGAIHSNLEQFDSAVPYYEESIGLLQHEQREPLESAVYNLAEAQFKRGQLSEAELLLARLEGGKHAYLKAAAKVLSAEIAAKRGNYELAKTHARVALQTAREHGWDDLETASLNLLTSSADGVK